MKELSIFIDESGDFGEYAAHSHYYIITMIFHDQNSDVQPAVTKLNQGLSYLKLNNLCIHTGPIIRREEIYAGMTEYLFGTRTGTVLPCIPPDTPDAPQNTALHS